MKFIFPQNYAFKNKLFGFIDYSTLVLNLVWDAFIFCLLDILIPNIRGTIQTRHLKHHSVEQLL